MKVHLQKVFIVSEKKEISIFDLQTFGLVHGSKKIVTNDVIMSVGFHNDKIYVG